MVVAEASISGIFKTVLMILGAFVLLRFLGQLATAKRNMELERDLNAKQRKFKKEKMHKMKHFGKTSILSRNSKKTTYSDSKVEDVDYEDLN